MTRQDDPIYSQYAPAIIAALTDLFRDEPDKEAHLFHFDLEQIDATAFFTAIPIAVNYVMNSLTGNEGDALEGTYTMNRLIAQHNIQRAKNGQVDVSFDDE